ncbi:hypothetical protein SAMN04515659_0319 [Dyella sp. 333MFSha]|nr:hypothetical protein SAMN04515659_0319 [Dyella sp. 333MFSha]
MKIPRCIHRSLLALVGGSVFCASASQAQAALPAEVDSRLVSMRLTAHPLLGPPLPSDIRIDEADALEGGSVTVASDHEKHFIGGIPVIEVAHATNTASVCQGQACPVIASNVFTLADLQVMNVASMSATGAIEWTSLPGLGDLSFDATIVTGAGAFPVTSHCPYRPGDTSPGTSIPISGKVPHEVVGLGGLVVVDEWLSFSGNLVLNDPCLAFDANNDPGTRAALLTLTGTLGAGILSPRYDVQATIGDIHRSP